MKYSIILSVMYYILPPYPKNYIYLIYAENYN